MFGLHRALGFLNLLVSRRWSHRTTVIEGNDMVCGAACRGLKARGTAPPVLAVVTNPLRPSSIIHRDHRTDLIKESRVRSAAIGSWLLVTPVISDVLPQGAQTDIRGQDQKQPQVADDECLDEQPKLRMQEGTR